MREYLQLKNRPPTPPFQKLDEAAHTLRMAQAIQQAEDEEFLKHLVEMLDDVTLE